MEKSSAQVKVTTKASKSRRKSGEVQINSYVIKQLLGKGSYGKVKLCTDLSSNIDYAIKIFSKPLLSRKKDYIKSSEGRLVASTALQAVLRELEIMKRLNHKNVIRTIEIIDDPESEKLYMIMEYCSLGSIMDWRPATREFYSPWLKGNLEKHILRKFIQELVEGLMYLHSINIVHRDIKPQNILLSQNFEIKLADFGQAQDISTGDQLTSTVGTYYFFAPECCSSDSEAFSGKRVDIWALGITIYALVYKTLPFWADSLLGIFEVIRSSEIIFEESIIADRSLIDLLRRLLEKNPNSRITLPEILVHPWMN
jgi:[calcium/calmodulin-dependent protein kinase] kinase